VSLRSLCCLSAGAPPTGLPSFPTRRSSDLQAGHAGVTHRLLIQAELPAERDHQGAHRYRVQVGVFVRRLQATQADQRIGVVIDRDRKSTRLNSSHVNISYAVICLKEEMDAL